MPYLDIEKTRAADRAYKARQREKRLAAAAALAGGPVTAVAAAKVAPEGKPKTKAAKPVNRTRSSKPKSRSSKPSSPVEKLGRSNLTASPKSGMPDISPWLPLSRSLPLEFRAGP